MAPGRCQESSIFLKVAFVCNALCTMLQTVGLATPYWWYRDNTISGVEVRIYHTGIWKECINQRGFTVCFDVDNDNEWFQAVRATSVAGVLGMAATTCGLFIGVCFIDHRCSRILTTVVGCLSGACSLIGIILYGADIEEAKFLHFSFALCSSAGILAFIAAMLMFCDLAVTAPSSGRRRPRTVVYYSKEGQTFAYPSGVVQEDKLPTKQYSSRSNKKIRRSSSSHPYIHTREQYSI